nr:three-Cys-motif partner protein TcmP [Burkholderia multivorans]
MSVREATHVTEHDLESLRLGIRQSPPTIRRHSEVKHAILRSYLVDYFLTLVSSPAQDRIRLTIVDGFCGGGCYLKGLGNKGPRSPIVILEAMREAQAKLMDLQQRRRNIDFDVELICIDESVAATCVPPRLQRTRSSTRARSVPLRARTR